MSTAIPNVSAAIQQATQAQIDKRKRPRITIDEINSMASEDLASHPALDADNRSRLIKVLDFVDAPRNAVANIIGGLVGVDREDKQKGTFGLPRIFTSDILRRLGVKNRAVSAVAGLLGDFAIDPLTYIGGAGTIKSGALRLTKGSNKAIRLAASQAARGTVPEGVLGKLITPATRVQFRGTKTALRDIAEEGNRINAAVRHVQSTVSNKLVSAGKRGVAARQFAEDFGARGSALFHIPLTEKEFIRLPVGKGVKIQQLIRNVKAAKDQETQAQALGEIGKFVARSKLPPKLLGDKLNPVLAKLVGKDAADLVTNPLSAGQDKLRDIFGTVTKSDQELQIDRVVAGSNLAVERAKPTLLENQGLRSGSIGLFDVDSKGRHVATGPVAEQARRLIEKGFFENTPEGVQSALRESEQNLQAFNELQLFPLAKDRAATTEQTLLSDLHPNDPTEGFQPVTVKSVGNLPEIGEKQAATELAQRTRLVPKDDAILKIVGRDTFQFMDESPEVQQLVRDYADQYSQVVTNEQALNVLGTEVKEGYAGRFLTPAANAQERAVSEFKGQLPGKLQKLMRLLQPGFSAKHRMTYYFLDDAGVAALDAGLRVPATSYHWNPSPQQFARLKEANPAGFYAPLSVFQMNELANKGVFNDFLSPEWQQFLKDNPGTDTWLIHPDEALARRRMASEIVLARKNYYEWVAANFGKWFPVESLKFPDPNANVFEGAHVKIGEKDVYGLVTSIDDASAQAVVKIGDEAQTVPIEGLTVMQNMEAARAPAKNITPPPGVKDQFRAVDPISGALFDQAGRGFLAFPREFADDIEKVHNLYFAPDQRELNALLDAMNKANGVLKTQMLLGAPYPVFNAIGNMVNMWAGGMFRRPDDMHTVLQSFQAMWRITDKDALRRIPDIITDTGQRLTWVDLADMAERTKVLNSTFAEELRTLQDTKQIKEILNNLPVSERSELSKLVTAPGSIVQKGLSKFFDANKFIEEANKLGMFAAMIQRGDDEAEAARKVFKFLFDYSRATPAESTLVAFTGFYRWVKNSAVLNFRQLMKDPKYAALVPKIQNALTVPGPTVDPELQQEFVRELAGAQFSGDAERGSTFSVLTGLPQNELRILTNPAESFVENIGPIPSILGSIGIGREIFTGRQIGSPGEPAANQTTLQFLTNQVRIKRDVARIMRQTNNVDRALAFVFGGRIQANDRERGLIGMDIRTTNDLRLLRARIKRDDISDEEKTRLADQILLTYKQRADFGLSVPKSTDAIIRERGLVGQ